VLEKELNSVYAKGWAGFLRTLFGSQKLAMIFLDWAAQM